MKWSVHEHDACMWILIEIITDIVECFCLCSLDVVCVCVCPTLFRRGSSHTKRSHSNRMEANALEPVLRPLFTPSKQRPAKNITKREVNTELTIRKFMDFFRRCSLLPLITRHRIYIYACCICTTYGNMLVECRKISLSLHNTFWIKTKLHGEVTWLFFLQNNSQAIEWTI